jgi:homoserine acetyltransferase
MVESSRVPLNGQTKLLLQHAATRSQRYQSFSYLAAVAAVLKHDITEDAEVIEALLTVKLESTAISTDSCTNICEL